MATNSVLDKITESKLLNVLASLGFVILTIGLWSGDGFILWKLLAVGATVFQINDTYKLYKKQ